MTAITGYRIQTADRDVNDLLDPTEQISRSWDSRGDTQDGVSVCESPEELARYLVTGGSGIPYGAGEWVIVELIGDQVLGRCHDEEYGERLVRPTEIVSVTPMGDDFFEMIAANFSDEEN